MARKQPQSPAYKGEVEIEVAGKKYQATYEVSRDREPLIEVRCLDPYGHKTTQVGGSSGAGLEVLAKMMLGEIVGQGLRLSDTTKPTAK